MRVLTRAGISAGLLACVGVFVVAATANAAPAHIGHAGVRVLVVHRGISHAPATFTGASSKIVASKKGTPSFKPNSLTTPGIWNGKSKCTAAHASVKVTNKSGSAQTVTWWHAASCRTRGAAVRCCQRCGRVATPRTYKDVRRAGVRGCS